MAGKDGESHRGRSSTSRRNALKSLRRKDTIGLIFIGSEKVGKTSLIKRWHYGHFSNEYQPTVEDFYLAHYSYEHQRVNVGIIDMTGSGQFPAMLELYIGKSDSIVYVYDVNDEKSVRDLGYHYDQVKTFFKDRRPVQSVVGTKIDSHVDKGDNYSNDHVKAFCDRVGANTKHCVTSAKLGLNVEQVFDNALLEIMQNQLPSPHNLQFRTCDNGPLASLCCWGNAADD